MLNSTQFIDFANLHIENAKSALINKDFNAGDQALGGIFQELNKYLQSLSKVEQSALETKHVYKEIFHEIDTTCKNLINHHVSRDCQSMLNILNNDLPNIISKLAKLNINVDKPRCIQSEAPLAYIENTAVGAKNLEIKLKRISEGGPFEWPNIVALNQAVSSLIGTAKSIVNIGAGTGAFEWHAAENNPAQFIASEFDVDCVNWCKENRARNNITYTNKNITELLKQYGKFDLAVSIEVIEHVKDYANFLSEFSQLADKAIITTPNKARTDQDLKAMPPKYYQHVREWTAGEFYWVLKTFYRQVLLYAMPDVYKAEIRPINILSTMTPLIAVCTK